VKNKSKTIVGTDIQKVKTLNKNSGLSYNEAKLVLAQKKGLLKD